MLLLLRLLDVFFERFKRGALLRKFERVDFAFVHNFFARGAARGWRRGELVHVIHQGLLVEQDHLSEFFKLSCQLG